MSDSVSTDVDTNTEVHAVLLEKQKVKPLEEAQSVVDIVKGLEASLGRFEEDAASKALDALKKVQKRNRQAKIKRRWVGFFTLLILGSIIWGIGYFAVTNIKVEHHSIVRNCSVKFGEGTITGTREIFYPSRSLFGWELRATEEEEAQTKIALKGDKMTIIGLDDNKKTYWRINVANGVFDKQLLKPAVWYMFIGDKTDAMIPADAFCR